MNQPWLTEPTYERWIHPSGLVCEIARADVLDNWRGYVQVPEDHPIRLFDLDPQGWDDTNPKYIKFSVHGGVTWASAGNLIYCPDKDVYRIGFDCAHAWDISPKYTSLFPGHPCDVQWRDIEYVRAETNSLAEQISKIKMVPEGFAL